jgi:uncharacterized protein (TIGR00251 family)
VNVAVRDGANGALFDVKVVPGAADDRIAGVLGSALKVRVAAPPEHGKANAAVCALLAQALGVAPRQVQVVRGAASARKVIAVHGLATAEVAARLQRVTS